MDSIWEVSIPLVRVDRNTTSTSVQARTGSYLIKAVDFNYNESVLAAMANTSIPSLNQLNVIDETDDFPSLLGEKVSVSAVDGVITLKAKQVGGVDTNEYFPEGYYYYTNFLDLGDIYTARLQSLVQAEGYTAGDIMSNWVTLDDVVVLSGAKYSEWDVGTEVRYTDKFNVMGDWASLDLVNPLSEGQQDNWSEWKKFTMGDFTGRIFQFRLKLSSFKASVTPRVISGEIRADMPDRILSYNNITVPIGGYSVLYAGAFKGPLPSPAIGITQDAMTQGDYYSISAKSVTGFTINMFDKLGNPVSRQIDILVKGYGKQNNEVIL
jgi:hypothetical protein